jgi:hypothetical protein
MTSNSNPELLVRGNQAGVETGWRRRRPEEMRDKAVNQHVRLAAQPIDYLSPDVPAELPWLEPPLVRATPESLRGYGQLVDDYQTFVVEIVRWPAQGWRRVDVGTGDQAGTTEGIIEVWWVGDFLYAKNGAVNDDYILGWSRNPREGKCNGETSAPAARVLLWHANYHPDGGQLFFPLDDTPFVVPLALPRDDVTPLDFVAFYIAAGRGLYIHPNVWHEGVFPLVARGRFYDKQGRVHARVSCNIAREFGVFLSVPLNKPLQFGEAADGDSIQGEASCAG